MDADVRPPWNQQNEKKNAPNLGSMAFGSFILAIVQFLRWWMYYIQKQAMTNEFSIPIPDQDLISDELENCVLIGCGNCLYGCDAWFCGLPICHYGRQPLAASTPVDLAPSAPAPLVWHP